MTSAEHYKIHGQVDSPDVRPTSLFQEAQAPWANYKPQNHGLTSQVFGAPPKQQMGFNPLAGHQQQQQCLAPPAYPQQGFREQAPNFGYSSPLGGTYMSPMSAAIHQRRDGDHAPLDPEPFNIRDRHISPKTPKPFDLFNGRADTYKTWISRDRDHLCLAIWLGDVC